MKTNKSAYNFSEDDLKEIKAAFDSFDLDKSKEIKAKDLKFILRTLGFEPKAEEIKSLIAKYDKSKSGVIKYDAFMKLIATKYGEKDSQTEIANAFKLFDMDNKGSITIIDLRRVAKELGEDIEEHYLQEMIAEADKNNDGKVDEEEFVKIMKKTGLY